MPDKHINELPTKTQLELDTATTLWIVGDPDTGTLYQVTIEQLKALVTPENNWKTVLSAAFGAVGGGPASSTFYGQITGKSGAFSSEAQTVYIIGEDCKAKNFFIATSTTQPASGDIIITIRKNFANSTLQITIPAGTIAGTFSNLIDVVDLVAGDLICFQFVNQATTTSCTFYSLGFSLVKIS